MSEPIAEEEIDFDLLHYKTVNQYCRIYAGFSIVLTDDTYVVVAHNKYLSVYNIEENSWINHIYVNASDIV